MIDVAEIKYHGEQVGAVRWDEERLLGSFQYTPFWLHNGVELAPLMMPLRQGGRIYSFPDLRADRESEFDTFKGLPGLLADALPDKYGNELIRLWLAQNGRATGSMNPVEQLCFIGSRGMGALEFEPSVLGNMQRTFKVELDGLVNYAAQMLQKRETFVTQLNSEEEKAMKDILRIGTSAGGARPKAVISYNEKTGEVRSGQTHAAKGFSQWIIKLDGVSDEQFGKSTGYGRVELAYAHMATDAGIEMMACRLLEENGRAHFMTRRFDRSPDGTKIHMQSWCALRHFDFNRVGYYSYEQLFETMRMLRLSYPETAQMFRRMVFNILARNCDDHTKNFAFLMDETGKWKLAPAFDVCYAYRPNSYWVSRQSLSLRGKRENFSEEDFLRIASEVGVKKAPLILAEIKNTISGWKKYAQEAGVSRELTHLVQKNLLV
ncbi:MAG: type II toxin-antitoxin system HipA family toxin [Bacteroidetes bacterium]|nr:type II toxin-antitoxin system HipA family toxin [Bacteroidota bacterium]